MDGDAGKGGHDAWVDRQYYSDGKPHKEIHYRGAKPHGWWREWHPNGVLAEESFFEDGIYVNTTIRKWNAKGVLQMEMPWINGQTNGRFSVHNDKGKLVFRSYMIDGRPVSRERYDQACQKRPELPRYTEADPPRTWGRWNAAGRKRIGPKTTPVAIDSNFSTDGADGFVTGLLNTAMAEAWTWLKENEHRSLGEMTPEDSADFVARAYNAGAMRVIAVEIEDNGGAETTNHLVLELPKNKRARARVFRFEKAQAQQEGFDGEADRGQRFVYLKLC